MKIVFSGIVAVVSAPASAQGLDLPTAPAVSSVVACRSQIEPAARLACYDSSIDVLSRSLQDGATVAVARDDIRRKGSSWFGLDLPDLKLFDDGGGEQEAKEQTASIKAARDLGYGKWVLTLDNGAHWQLTETLGTQLVPRAGQSVRIRRTRVGGYMLSIDSGRLLRAKRIG